MWVRTRKRGKSRPPATQTTPPISRRASAPDKHQKRCSTQKAPCRRRMHAALFLYACSSLGEIYRQCPLRLAPIVSFTYTRASPSNILLDDDLAEFDFVVSHIPGKENVVADYLSRHVIPKAQRILQETPNSTSDFEGVHIAAIDCSFNHFHFMRSSIRPSSTSLRASTKTMTTSRFGHSAATCTTTPS